MQLRLITTDVKFNQHLSVFGENYLFPPAHVFQQPCAAQQMFTDPCLLQTHIERFLDRFLQAWSVDYLQWNYRRGGGGGECIFLGPAPQL